MTHIRHEKEVRKMKSWYKVIRVYEVYSGTKGDASITVTEDGDSTLQWEKIVRLDEDEVKAMFRTARRQITDKKKYPNDKKR